MNKLVRLGISVALLTWLGLRTDWVQVGQVFGRLRLEWWLGAVGVFVVTQVLSAYRWQLLARPLGFRQSLKQFTSFYLIGMYFNLFLPTSVGGDVVRAYYLDGGTGRKLAAFLSAFVDRFSGLLILLNLACLGMAFCPIDLPSWVSWSVWGTMACALAGLLAAPVLMRLTRRFARVRRLAQGARLYLRHPGILTGSLGLSLLIQTANIVIVWMVGRAMGANAPLAYFWILVPMVTLLTMIPVSLNGMGVREWGMMVFLKPLGIPETTAFSLAFLWFLIFTATSLLGGGLYLFGRFPSPQVQPDHEPVRGDSDQGRTGQLEAAA